MFVVEMCSSGHDHHVSGNDNTTQRYCGRKKDEEFHGENKLNYECNKWN